MDKILLIEMQLFINRNKSDSNIKDTDYFPWLDTSPEKEEEITLQNIPGFYYEEKELYKIRGKAYDTPIEDVPNKVKYKPKMKKYHPSFDRRSRRIILRSRYISNLESRKSPIPKTLQKLVKQRNLTTIEY